ncbi:MAG TPA: hypothetical protein VFG43_13240 [Geminicoccaceae bacterium]|nr:hypothetical protein [Geminicoccaceae bacterium]
MSVNLGQISPHTISRPGVGEQPRLPEGPPPSGKVGGHDVAVSKPSLRLDQGTRTEAPPPRSLRDGSVIVTDRRDGGIGKASSTAPLVSAPPPQPTPPKSFSSDVRERLLTGKELVATMGKEPARVRKQYIFFGKTVVSNYRQTFNEVNRYHQDAAKLKISGDPATRRQQLDGLKATLGQVKVKAQNYIDAGHNTKHTQAMRGLIARVDQEIQLLDRVAAHPAMADPKGLTWGHAAEFPRHGVPFSVHTKTDGLHDDQLVGKPKVLGAGAFNQVVLAKYAGRADPVVIKQLQAEEVGSRGAVASLTGIPRINPRYGARNVATSIMNDKLGVRVVPKSQYAIHQGRLAVAMDKAPGVQAAKAAQKLPPALTLHNPNLQKACNELEWLDAIMGQGDRHDGNYHVEIGKDGSVKLGGIDNDQCAGKRFADPDALIRRAPEDGGEVVAWNVGLPPIIGRELADKIQSLDFDRDIRPDLADQLDDDELAAMKSRFDAAKAKVGQLERSGHVIDDWASWRKPGDAGKGVVDVLREQPLREGPPRSDGRVRMLPPSYLLRDFDRAPPPPTHSPSVSDARLAALKELGLV